MGKSSGAQLLTLSTIHVLDDGELAKDFNEQLQALVKDCVSRPGIDKARELRLTVKIKPAALANGQCDDVFVECFTTSKQPNRPIEIYRMRTTANGGAKFQPDSPLSPDQKDLGFDDE